MRGKCATSSMREDEGMNPVGVMDRFCCDDEPLRKVRPNVGESASSQTAFHGASQSFHRH